MGLRRSSRTAVRHQHVSKGFLFVRGKTYSLPWHHNRLFAEANIFDPGSREHEIFARTSDRVPIGVLVWQSPQ